MYAHVPTTSQPVRSLWVWESYGKRDAQVGVVDDSKGVLDISDRKVTDLFKAVPQTLYLFQMVSN
jgi:hypothetical protein